MGWFPGAIFWAFGGILGPFTGGLCGRFPLLRAAWGWTAVVKKWLVNSRIFGYFEQEGLGAALGCKA